MLLLVGPREQDPPPATDNRTMSKEVEGSNVITEI